MNSVPRAIVLLLFALATGSPALHAQQIDINRIEQMPARLDPNDPLRPGLASLRDRLIIISAEQQQVTPEQAAKDYFVSMEPTSLLQRFVQSEEVAQAVVSTAANPAITGASVRVEGGIIASL